jgi:hypothetical protein
MPDWTLLLVVDAVLLVLASVAVTALAVAGGRGHGAKGSRPLNSTRHPGDRF